jgi:O-antigen ligase
VTAAAALRLDDAPADALGGRGFFSFASTSLRGLSGPFWILQGYLFLSVAAIDEEWPAVGRYRPRLLLGTLALAAAVLRAFVERAPARDRAGAATAEGRRVPGRLGAFLATGFLSATVAFAPTTSFEAQLDHATKAIGFFLLLAIVRTRRELLLTVLVLAAGAGFFLLRSFTEFLAGKYDFQMGVVRMLGAGQEYADPNSFAATIVFALPLVAWAGIHSRSWLLRFCAVCYGALGAGSIAQTRSRSGAVLLAIACVGVAAALKTTRSRLLFAGALALVVVVLAAKQTQGALDRYASLVSADTYGKESSTGGRIEGYVVGWKMLQERPLLGVGPGCWSDYRQRRVDGSRLLAHNLPGQLLGERGAVGAAAWVAYLLAAVALGRAERRRLASASDPEGVAMRAFATACLFTLFLLGVSGLAAHNLDRPGWYWTGALLVLAVSTARDAGREGPEAVR